MTAGSAGECAGRLAGALVRSPDDDQVQMVQAGNQWYLRVFMDRDVTLSQVEEALKDGGPRLPRGKLRLFGHVILEIDARAASPQELIRDLEVMGHVAVAGSKTERGLLRVTVEMPYPVPKNGADRGSLQWEETFRRFDPPAPAAKPEAPATAATLPSYEDFRRVVAKHGAELKDVRLSTEYACRAVGCVAAPGTDAAGR